MGTTLISDERIPMGYTTIEDALTRTETPEEKKRAREERRVNMVASRRRKAAEALAKLPGLVYVARAVAEDRIGDLDYTLTDARAECRKLAATDEHEVAARLALEALGALWAVL